MSARDIDPKWEEHIDLIRRTVAQGATPDELRHFLYIAKTSGLDPLAKQIYYIRRKGKGTIQVAIDGLRLIADRTGRYAGGDAAEYLGTTEEGYPQIARVTVYKMVGGVRCPFSSSARWEEFYPGDDQGFTWRRMPHTMLAKVAEAHALRRAFPSDMSGLYVHEEMAQAGGVADGILADLNGAVPEDAPSAPSGEGKSAPSPIPEPVAATPQAPENAPEERTAVEIAERKALPTAFGYAPPQWPSAKMMGEPATENQFRMLRRKADQRHLVEREVGRVREAVLAQYGVDEGASKGAVSLVIDFIAQATPAQLDAARGVRRGS